MSRNRDREAASKRTSGPLSPLETSDEMFHRMVERIDRDLDQIVDLPSRVTRLENTISNGLTAKVTQMYEAFIERRKNRISFLHAAGIATVAALLTFFGNLYIKSNQPTSIQPSTESLRPIILETIKEVRAAEEAEPQMIQEKAKPRRRTPSRPVTPGGRGSTMRTARVTTDAELAQLHNIFIGPSVNSMTHQVRSTIPWDRD